MVFSDATLEDMAAVKPKNLAEMGKVHGVGAFKLEKYGRRFLEVLLETDTEEEKEEEMENDEDSTLLEDLKNLRRRMAGEVHKAPKSIFSDEILSSMVLQRPTTLEELKRIRGIGSKKAAAYGMPFLRLLGNSTPPPAPPSGDIIQGAYFLFLKKVRDRLAGDGNRESFFPEENLRRLSRGDDSVLAGLPAEEASAFRKAVENYKKIRGN